MNLYINKKVSKLNDKTFNSIFENDINYEIDCSSNKIKTNVKKISKIIIMFPKSLKKEKVVVNIKKIK